MAGPVAIDLAKNAVADKGVYQWRLALLIAIAVLAVVQFVVTTLALRREAAARQAALQAPVGPAAPVGGVAAAFAQPATTPYDPVPPADNAWATPFSDAAAPVAAAPVAAAPVAAATMAEPEPSLGAPTVPAGWAPDPYGRHEMRFWDGAKWTEEVYSAGSRGVDPI